MAPAAADHRARRRACHPLAPSRRGAQHRRYVPDDPSEGETVAHVGPQDITPGQPVAFQVEVTKGPAWLACFVDPDTPEAEARRILLFPPPAEEMKIR